MAQFLNRLFLGTTALGAISLLLSQSFFLVKGGHKAVIWNRNQGVKDKVVKGEGINFIIPFWEKPKIFNVRITPKAIFTETVTKDLQTIQIGVRVLYRPQIENLPLLYRKYGLDYALRLLPSFGNEVLKAVVAQYDAIELITQRERVSGEIRENLTKRSKDCYILLEDVAITHLTFGPEFTAAVERKQIEQQIAERAKFEVEKAEQIKLATILRAEGEAEAGRLISEATSYSSAYVELKRIEAAIEIARTLSKSNKILFLPSSNSLLLNLGGLTNFPK